MQKPYELLEKIRKEKPLVHHITNWVTIAGCADITRALGALPIMAHAREEVEEMAGISSALVLNIGTLTSELVDAMELAARKANARGIPVILDCVGAGATKMRTDACRRLIGNVKIDVVKGNAGEIGAIAGIEAVVRGVESVSVSGEPREIARDLAARLGCAVVITGKDDIASNGKETFIVSNGHEMMGRVVGTGCMASSCLGAFCAVEKDCAKACACAMAVYGIAGELAAKKAAAPLEFKQGLIDEICSLDGTAMEMARVKIC